MPYIFVREKSVLRKRSINSYLTRANQQLDGNQVPRPCQNHPRYLQQQPPRSVIEQIGIHRQPRNRAFTRLWIVETMAKEQSTPRRIWIRPELGQLLGFCLLVHPTVPDAIDSVVGSKIYFIQSETRLELGWTWVGPGLEPSRDHVQESGPPTPAG